MAPRASWKGFLNLSLVSIPVKAYTANNSSGTVRLNQLHAECNSRIRQKTVCPKCDEEVSRSDIVKGFEYAKDQYVVIDLEELEKLRSEDEGKSIRLAKFIPPTSISPIYYSDTTYYLIPDGAAGQKSYSLLRQTMEKEDLFGVGQIVLYNKEQLVVVRPVGNLICMTNLKYTAQIKDPEVFDEEVTDCDITTEEYELAKTLIGQITTEDFSLDAYADKYNERLNELIEAKVEGKEIVSSPAAEESPQIVNLMDALKASITQASPIDKNKGKSAASGTMKKVAKKGPKKKGSSSKKADLAGALGGAKKKKKSRSKKTG